MKMSKDTIKGTLCIIVSIILSFIAISIMTSSLTFNHVGLDITTVIWSIAGAIILVMIAVTKYIKI